MSEARNAFQDETTATLRRPDFLINRNYQVFHNLVHSKLTAFLESMGPWEKSSAEYAAFGVTSEPQLVREAGLFRAVLNKAFALAMDKGKTARSANPLFWNLRNAFIRHEIPGLSREIKYAFQTFMTRKRYGDATNDLHLSLTDLRHPYEWFPATRMLQRTIHLHVGPTNSGKTYNALKALEGARSGVFAGPLRLLAHETWSRLIARGKPCALITGEEVRMPTDSDTWLSSCTVEMTPLNARLDVAVIDEIQMMAHPERGWAWTQAFLGVQAKEVHLCGEDRVVPLIQDMCARLGEPCIVHRYERLNPLETMDESLKGDFSNLQKGDAVVAFTKVNIHQLKAGIENETGRRCAIVYGSLPPETRASQAALFNDPNNDYDFLVASDAIGMGLNLEVKRIVFYASNKFDGTSFRPLTVPEVKQIGGRAGRYRTAAQELTGNTTKPSPGFVTALDDEDLPHIHKAFQTEAPPIQTAGIFPPPAVIEKFYSQFPPNTPISFVLARLRELARLSGRFHLCDFTDALSIAEIIKPFDLSIADRCMFLAVPVSLRDAKQVAAVRAFARCVADLGSGHLLDFPVIDLEVLDVTNPRDPRTHLHRLESLHATLSIYLWLSYRYQGVFQSQHLAARVKEMVEEKIAGHLENLSFVSMEDLRRRKLQRKLAAKAEELEKTLLEPGEDDLEGQGGKERVGGWLDGDEPIFEEDEEEGVVVEGGEEEPTAVGEKESPAVKEKEATAGAGA